MSSLHRLSITLTQRRALLPYSLHDSPPFVTPLVCLVDNIFFFPILWRKFILNTCRIQKDPKTNQALRAMLSDLEPKRLLYPVDTGYYSTLLAPYFTIDSYGQEIQEALATVTSVFSDN